MFPQTQKWRYEMIWNPERSENYSRDCALGRLLFKELLDDMKKTGNVYLLSRTVEAQVANGIFGGVEIGFHAALTEALSVASTANG